MIQKMRKNVALAEHSEDVCFNWGGGRTFCDCARSFARCEVHFLSNECVVLIRVLVKYLLL